MTTFSERAGTSPEPPPRVTREEAPEALRALLLELLIDDWGTFESYKEICRLIGRLPHPDIAGDHRARRDTIELVSTIPWYVVFDLLEAVGRRGRHDATINACFLRCGLGYEISNGRIELLDRAARELGVDAAPIEATEMLAGKFAPVREQYVRAIDALNQRPADLEKAVSESLGALEAVARIITGEKDFGAAVQAAFKERKHGGALQKSLQQLYGWSSQLPGARHGRHEEPDVTYDEASYAVRAVGAAIVLLVTGASRHAP